MTNKINILSINNGCLNGDDDDDDDEELIYRQGSK
jgi:hypothetical protein